MGKTLSIIFFSILFLVGTGLAAAWFFPWKNIQWGSIEYAQARTITVSGSSEQQQRSQIAQFSAGVSAVNNDRETAVNEVNNTIAKVIQVAKDFGIPEEDIKTQNMSIYRDEQTIYVEGRPSSTPGQWRVNNTIEIKLRDVDKASDLATKLAGSGATNVYGPNFMVDDTSNLEDSLLESAIADAREKAEIMAKGSGAELGEVITVVEGYSSSGPFYGDVMFAREAGGGGGVPTMPGSSTVAKTVTVTFGLK